LFRRIPLALEGIEHSLPTLWLFPFRSLSLALREEPLEVFLRLPNLHRPLRQGREELRRRRERDVDKSGQLFGLGMRESLGVAAGVANTSCRPGAGERLVQRVLADYQTRGVLDGDGCTAVMRVGPEQITIDHVVALAPDRVVDV